MAASNADKFKKMARKWVGQIGSGGVADDSVTTIPLASTTNLPTDTGVVAVIDRVDSNGTATSSLEETVIGVVSGTNLVTSTRGAEGTAQAHSAGAVVEILFTNKGWGDLVDGLLVQHNQSGLHTDITACNVTASGTVNVGSIVATPLSSGVGATITNAGTGNGLFIDQNGNGIALNIDSEATTNPAIYYDIPVNNDSSSIRAFHGGTVKFELIRNDDVTTAAVVMRLGTSFIWVDATGDLRISTTYPVSDTSGTVVGTQT